MRSRSVFWRRFGMLLVGASFLAAGAVYFAYSRDMQASGARLVRASQVIQTRHGAVEFAAWGSGPSVLALHGAGGGFDQGRLLAEAFGGDGFRWVAPSRFGYLRSALPADASTAAQADACAELLDELGIDRVSILAMSGGVPPALQFALRHPARTAALVLLSSAPYTPFTVAQQDLPVPIWLYQALFGWDFPYWALSKGARSSLETIFDVKPELRVAMTPEEQAFVAGLVDAFAPVTRRTDGLANEGAAIDPRTRYPLAEIRVPALVVHARDDGINSFVFGEHTARHIARAEFMPLASGGHLLLGHRAQVRSRVGAFLREHAPLAKP